MKIHKIKFFNSGLFLFLLRVLPNVKIIDQQINFEADIIRRLESEFI